jgi:DNA-binding transcriptional MerR regulator
MATPDAHDPTYSIGEVSERVGQEPHVLRYWEQEFESLAPAKDSNGRRTYTEADIQRVERIQYLLKEKKYTIAGARQAMERNEETDAERHALRKNLQQMRGLLQTMLDGLDDGNA